MTASPDELWLAAILAIVALAVIAAVILTVRANWQPPARVICEPPSLVRPLAATTSTATRTRRTPPYDAIERGDFDDMKELSRRG